MIILATTIIISLNNNGIIDKANEATFKANAKNYQQELSLYISDFYSNNPELDVDTINASATTTPSIKDMITSIKEEDISKFEVIKGNLTYVGEDVQEKQWCISIGIKTPTNKDIYEKTYKTEIENALNYGYITEEGYYKLKDEYLGSYLMGTGDPDLVQGTIAIPYGVVGVIRGTFAECSNLEKVILSETAENLEGAFMFCYGLEEVVFPEGVTNIPKETFMQCTSLVVKIPSSVKTIGYYAFNGCWKVIITSNITVADGAFAWIKNLVISEGVTEISGVGSSDTAISVSIPSTLKDKTAVQGAGTTIINGGEYFSFKLSDYYRVEANLVIKAKKINLEETGGNFNMDTLYLDSTDVTYVSPLSSGTSPFSITKLYTRNETIGKGIVEAVDASKITDGPPISVTLVEEYDWVAPTIE